MYEYCRVIYQSFGCIDMLSLCIYESFELLIVNVGYNMNVSCEPEFDMNVYLFCCICV